MTATAPPGSSTGGCGHTHIRGAELGILDVINTSSPPRQPAVKVHGATAVSCPDAARAAGVTYRQLNYWIAMQAVRPAFGTGGSGNPYGFTPRQVEILRQIGHIDQHLQGAGGLGMQTEFIRRVWDALEATGEFHYADGPVVIHLPWPADALDPPA